MRPLTPAERAILEAFQDRDVFTAREAANVVRVAVGNRRYWKTLMAMRDVGWLDRCILYLYVREGSRSNEEWLPVDPFRVTAKGRRALRDGGTR